MTLSNRRAIRPTWIGIGIVLLVVPLSGCGDSMGSANGTVTYEGQRVGEGWINFTPADGKGPTSGAAITNGAYEASDIPPGKKVVSIQAVKQVPFARSSEEMAKKAEEQKKAGNNTGLIDPADEIPPDAVGNNTEVTIAAGSQTLDFSLTRPSK